MDYSPPCTSQLHYTVQYSRYAPIFTVHYAVRSRGEPEGGLHPPSDLLRKWTSFQRAAILHAKGAWPASREAVSNRLWNEGRQASWAILLIDLAFLTSNGLQTYEIQAFTTQIQTSIQCDPKAIPISKLALNSWIPIKLKPNLLIF